MTSDEMKPRMKVVIFTSILGGGGAEHQALRTANYLDEERFEVLLAVARPDGTYERRLKRQVELHHLAPPGLTSSTMSMVAAMPPLRRLLRDRRPDVVCSFMEHASVTAGLVCKSLPPLARPRLVCGIQNTLSERRPTQLVHRAVLAGARRTYRGADRVIALSHGVADDLVNHLPIDRQRIRVVHNAGFDDDLPRMAAQPLMEAVPGRPLLVACGRLVKQKGFRYLVEAVAIVRRSIEAHLWILGEGPERAGLERQIDDLGLKGAVRLIGFQRNPYPFMASADVFVLSSLFEGFGNVVAEAMATGTPVVATDCPHGPAEIIGSSSNGVLVPRGDGPALADGILRLLTSSERRAAIAAAACVRIQSFHARNSAGGYAAVFDEFISNT